MDKIKTILILILSGAVTIAVGLWLFSTIGSLDSRKIIIAGLIIILGIFSFSTSIKKLKKQSTNH